MILAEVSTVLSISITLMVITLVVVSLLMILVVMMQRPKQEGLGAAFGGGMTDQLLGAGTTSFLQKATVVLGILFFALSLILGILVGKSNKALGLDTKAAAAAKEGAEAVPDIADDVVIGDGEEDELLKALGVANGEGTPSEPAPTEEPSAEEPSAEETPTEETPTEEIPTEEIPAAVMPEVDSAEEESTVAEEEGEASGSSTEE